MNTQHTLTAFGLALAATVLTSSLVLAQTPAPTAQTPSVATSITLSGAYRQGQNGAPNLEQYILTAKLTAADGKPLNNRGLEFFQKVDLLGPKESAIGTATTDSTGVGRLVFLPAQGGPQSFVVYFAGADGFAKSQVSATLDLGTVETPFEPEPLPFALMRGFLPIGIGGLVAAIWVVLLVTLLRTALVIRRAGRSLTAASADGRVSPGGGGR